MINQSVYKGNKGGQAPDALDNDTIEFMEEFDQAQDEAGRRNQRNTIQIGRSTRQDESKPRRMGSGFM